MKQEFDVLDIRILRQEGSQPPRGGDSPERVTVDFLVNGASLHEMLNASGHGLVGRFAVDKPALNQEAADVFLLKAQPDTEGRAILFECPMCADLGCGAILVKITATENGYCWSGFAYDNGWGEGMPDLATYREIPQFLFSTDNYLAAIAGATAQGGAANSPIP